MATKVSKPTSETSPATSTVKRALDWKPIREYGDIIFETAILEKLLKSPADISLVVDLSWHDTSQRGQSVPHLKPDLVTLQNPPGKTYLSRYVLPEEENRIARIGHEAPPMTRRVGA